MIECSKLSKAYLNQLVIDEFSYEFKDAGFYLLLGESGSGKTTLLNILAGLTPFDGGIITWNDLCYTEQVDNSVIQDSFAYITQDAFFVDFLSIGDNLRLIDSNESKILSTLARFGLANKINHFPSTLSGGEKQRLAIVRAILSNKKVLLLDEPTASLDDKNKQNVFELLRDIKSKILIICSSHDKQACDYADHIIHFEKSAKEVNITGKQYPNESLRINGSSKGKTKGISPYLNQWFVLGRKPKAMLLYLIFLILSFCLFIFADLPRNKLEASMENLYKINMLTVITYGNTQWEEIAPSNEDICEIVLDYSASCPDGNEQLSPEVAFRPLPDYEISLNVLPKNKKDFKLSDKIKYGTYFTNSEQIILSWEMANALAPGKEASLLGSHISKTIYGKGTIHFEIVGIFDKFNDFEKAYLQAIDIHIAQGRSYLAEDYAQLFFVSAQLTDSYKNDPSFHSGDRLRRGYRIYFNSYSDMKNYYDTYHSIIENTGNASISYASINVGLFGVLEVVFLFALPLAVFVALFSTMFYVSLLKTEYTHNNKFVAVFELSGYSKKTVIQQFIILNIIDLFKLLVASILLAFLITTAINIINEHLICFNYQLFTYNILMLISFVLGMLVLSALLVNSMFQKVRVTSWYENLIATRDLL